MVAAKLDLVGENAIEKGADYKRMISTCNHPKLTEYNGYCEIRTKGTNTGSPILTPRIIVNDDTHYTIEVQHDQTANLTSVGEFEYDVKFVATTASDVFYSARGKVQILDNVTELPTTP